MRIILLLLISISTFAQPTAHDHWKKLFNSNIDSIQKIYNPKAVLITPDGILHRTPEERVAFYAKLKNRLGTISSVTTIREEEITPDMSFEIGYFITDDSKKFMHLLVGKKVNNDFVREVEILSESNGEPLDATGINKARIDWMKLCNTHKANELVSKAYTSNAIYYNNNRILVGTAPIAKEYSYMNNPSYQLTLTPLIAETAGKDLVFEIGQCSGSYGGKYTLVWKKEGDSWKVLFDSN
jgi:ketosteroid isomerase-like protein